MNKYLRQIAVPQLGEMGQKKLKKAHVGIVGAGGLGCPVSAYLVGAGVGKITLIDHDIVSESNLHRQVLYRESDIGHFKTDVARQTLNDLNHEVDIVTFAERLTPDNVDSVLSSVDVVVDATDNFALSYLLSDFAYAQKKPLVSASVVKTVGYVGVYCWRTDTHEACPSLRAVFPNPPEVGQDCNSVGVIGTAAGAIGTLQAQEVLKVILCDSAQLAGRLLYLDLWQYRQAIMDFSNAPEPAVSAEIINQSEWSDDDWVIDVRGVDECEMRPKFSHQHTPVQELAVEKLPRDKRLVFTCASGQRALAMADKAIAIGFTRVAVCL